MYKVRWWQENGSWQITVSRQIGPHTFRASRLIPVNPQPTVESCSQAEQQCLNEVKHQIISQGGKT